MHAYQTLASMGELVKMRMVLLRANAKDIGRNLYAKVYMWLKANLLQRLDDSMN